VFLDNVFLGQECTNPCCQIAVMTTFCMVALIFVGPQVEHASCHPSVV